MRTEKWNTLRLAGLGAAGGAVYGAVQAWPWLQQGTRDALAYGAGYVIGGAVVGALLAAVIAGVRNALVN